MASIATLCELFYMYHFTKSSKISARPIEKIKKTKQTTKAKQLYKPEIKS